MPHAEAALRFCPRDPARGTRLAALGFAQFASRDYAGAAHTAGLAPPEAPGSATPLILDAIAWVGTGQIDRATAGFAQVNGIAPRLAPPEAAEGLR